MSWFGDQIKLRMEQDNKAFEDSFMNNANAVLGGHLSFEDRSADDDINEILKFYHCSPVQVPDEVKDFDGRLEYCCRPHGIMRRDVLLDDKWYNDCFGALLAKRKDDGSPVALLPKGFQNYVFFDAKTEKFVKVSGRNCDLFEREAICFYKPLPLKKIGTVDLVKYAVSTWSVFDVVLTVVLLGVATLLGLLTPKLNYFLFSEVVKFKSYSLLFSTLVFMVCLSLSGILLSAARNLLSGRTSTKMSMSVESAAMMRVLSLPSSFFRKYSSGEISQRLGYVSSLSNSVVNAIFSTGLTSLFSLAYISQIFVYSPSLVKPALLVIIVTVCFSVISTIARLKIARQSMELSAKNNGIAFSMLTGIQKIKLAGAEKRMFARWANEYSKEARLRYNPPLFLKLNGVITLAIGLVGQVIIYFLAVKTHVGTAEYYAFSTAYGMVSGAFTSLAGIALTFANIKPTLEMAKPILQSVPEMSEGRKVVTKVNGRIEMDNITFSYADGMPNIFDDFSLKIKSGEYVAIVGKTGCGKSTLVRLILGLEKPQKGAIYVDGKDISTVDLKSLRRSIGTVMQDDGLFQGDIYSNIVISAPWLTLEQAWEAAELAGIADDIRNMPMGMNTLISEGGGGISGGQRQRLMIARAIASKPRVLIFDEATSALDNITQRKVSEAIDSLKCTRIVIAHRLSTIRHCDRIIVIDGGKVVEEGTYEALIEQNGMFADLVARQRLDV